MPVIYRYIGNNRIFIDIAESIEGLPEKPYIKTLKECDSNIIMTWVKLYYWFYNHLNFSCRCIPIKSDNVYKKGKFKIMQKGRTIEQYDSNGNFIKEGEIKDFVDEGFNFSMILKVCNRKCKKYKGFVFKYKE